jgi:hypothetical protein
MQYLLYCVVCFRVRGTTREVFMVNVMEATLANHGVFTPRHAKGAKIASMRYKRANGSHPLPIMTHITHSLSS